MKITKEIDPGDLKPNQYFVHVFFEASNTACWLIDPKAKFDDIVKEIKKSYEENPPETYDINDHKIVCIRTYSGSNIY